MINKWIRWILIPILLLCVWIVMSLTYMIFLDISPTVVSSNIYIKNISNLRITNKNKLSIPFKSQEDHFGIVSIRFKKHVANEGLSIQDNIVFKIKEANSNRWLYSSQTPLNNLNALTFYPFGFPVIASSKNKYYVVELSLNSADSHQYIRLSEDKPTATATYQFSKQLLRDPKLLVYYILIKYKSSVQNTNFFVESLTFLTPLFLYLLFQISRTFLVSPYSKKLYTKYGISLPNIFSILPLFLIYFSISFKSVSLLSYLILIALWIWNILVYKYRSNNSLIISLFCLLSLPIYLSIRADLLAEKMALWSMLFFSIGVYQSFFEQN